MDILTLIKQARHELPFMAYSLYVELLVAGDGGDVVIGNDILVRYFEISLKTLIKYRLVLVSGGWIEYIAGDGKGNKGLYKIAFQRVEQRVYAKGGEIILGTPFEVNTGKGLKGGAKGASKGCTPRKKVEEFKFENEGTEIWAKCVEVWFEFYKLHYKLSPTFENKEVAVFKNILKKLEKTTIEKQATWSAEYAPRILGRFLQVAKEDKWVSENFGLAQINAKYDNIINNALNGKQSKSNSSAGTMAAMHVQLSQLNAAYAQTRASGDGKD